MEDKVKYPNIKFERVYKKAVWNCMRILGKAHQWPDLWPSYEKRCQDKINQLTKDTHHRIGHIGVMREVLKIFGANPDAEGFYPVENV